jgi:hypothetical protein
MRTHIKRREYDGLYEVCAWMRGPTHTDKDSGETTMRWVCIAVVNSRAQAESFIKEAA